MADTAHFLNSSLREKVIEHLFVGELLRHLWCNGVREIELLRAEVDAGGYDLVLECNGVGRHIQLKASHRSAKTGSVSVNTKLARKPNGCVIWIFFDPITLELGPFLWFGGPAGERLPDLGTRFGRHTRANSKGVKANRDSVRVLKKTEFSPLATMADVAHALFGGLRAGASRNRDDRARLERLAAFAERFRDPAACFGTWVSVAGNGTPDEPYSQPYVALSELGSAFVGMASETGWILRQFDWSSWALGPRAQMLLNDPDALADASPEELAKLLTVVVRQDRFIEGGADGQFKKGLLLRIAERAEALCTRR